MDFTKGVHAVQILNGDDEESTMFPEEVLLLNSDPNPERFIVSDADEELIILIKFNKSVDLKSFKIYALPLDDDSDIDDVAPPKQIHIYKLSHLNQDFEDIKGLKTIGGQQIGFLPVLWFYSRLFSGIIGSPNCCETKQMRTVLTPCC